MASPFIHALTACLANRGSEVKAGDLRKMGKPLSFCGLVGRTDIKGVQEGCIPQINSESFGNMT